jgi:hypothetical protein
MHAMQSVASAMVSAAAAVTWACRSFSVAMALP